MTGSTTTDNGKDLPVVRPEPEDTAPKTGEIGPQPHPAEGVLRWKVALVAVIAAAVTAVATLVGQTITALVGSDTARDVASQNFLHTERKDAYTEFLEDFDVLAEAHNDAVTQLQNGSSTASQAVDTWHAAYSDWAHDYTTLTIIASSESLGIVGDTRGQQLIVYEHFKAWLKSVQDGTPPPDPTNFYEATNTVGLAIESFRSQAHSELTDGT